MTGPTTTGLDNHWTWQQLDLTSGLQAAMLIVPADSHYHPEVSATVFVPARHLVLSDISAAPSILDLGFTEVLVREIPSSMG